MDGDANLRYRHKNIATNLASCLEMGRAMSRSTNSSNVTPGSGSLDVAGSNRWRCCVGSELAGLLRESSVSSSVSKNELKASADPAL